jgi:hypothetical protein
MKNKFKIQVDGINVNARRAIKPEDFAGDPATFVCPSCRQAKNRKKAIVDCTQYGFTWDHVITVFKCKCGQQFFGEYQVWHTESEVIA